MKKTLLAITVSAFAFLIVSCRNHHSPLATPKHAVLVFSKTVGYRHKSIPDGIRAIRNLGDANRFAVVATEDAGYFNKDSLRKFSAVIFLSPTGDVLNEEQEKAFQEYIRSGGGYVGIHAATDCEYEWDWYGKLVGGYFESHPDQQVAKIQVVDRKHPSTAHLPEIWERKDEWYNFKSLNPDVNVLMKLDEASYEGGNMNNNHPIAWYQYYEGGRIWYTGLGHSSEAYTEPAFLNHILGGILFAIGK